MSSEVPLPTDWRWGPLAEIAEINPLISLGGLSDALPVTFLAMSDVGENGRVLHQQARLLAEVKSGFTRFAENDVLFAKITPCMENGKGAQAQGLMNGLGFGSTEFHVLRAKPTADAGFIYHVAQSISLRQKAAMQMTGSAGQQRVPADFFERFRLPLPPLSEQRKIARILSTVDDLIERTEALIAKHRAIKQGLMHDLLTRGVDASGRLRPLWEEAPELYRESAVGWVPREWEIRPVGDFTLSSSFGPRFPSSAYSENGNVATLRTTDLDDEGNINFASMPLANLDNNFLQPHLLQINDLLITRSGTIGVTSVFPGYHMPVVPGAFSIRFRFGEGLNPQFARLFFNSRLGRPLLEREAQGGVQKNITGTAIKKIAIPVPDSTEQQRLCDRISACNRRIAGEQGQVQLLQDIKAGLMQDLLTGRVRVKV